MKNLAQSPEIYLVIPKSKIYSIVNIEFKSLRIIIYNIPKKISKARDYSIIRNFSIIVVIKIFLPSLLPV